MSKASSDGTLDLDAAARFIGETPREVERLARAGVVPRQAGRFNPVALVRGYVEHVRAEARRRDESPTQTEIADHLDLSERRVRDLVAALGLDHRENTLSDIRVAYIRELREKAAGRGGEDHAALTKARTQQAIADAQMKELTFYRELRLLVPVNEVEPLLAGWATTARSEVQYSVEKLVAGIQSQHGIEVDQALIDDTFDPAFRAIGSYPSNLAADADAGRDGVGSGDAAANAPVAG